MAKNILIFSDGTGQVGGLKPDQRLSNIYKLYRASRVSPENTIDPDAQIAFYDPGLGTSDKDEPIWSRPINFVRRSLAMATGTGIGRNMVDCYEFIIEHWEPGDRIYLFGFSRGGYTVRCLSNALSLCGVPTIGSNGNPLRRRGREARGIAEKAVYEVYDHAAGKRNEAYIEERNELARRFREKYRSFDTTYSDRSNAVPYFIGVFDAVSALGLKTVHRILAIAAAASATFIAVLGALSVLRALGRRASEFVPFNIPFGSIEFNVPLTAIFIVLVTGGLAAWNWLPRHQKTVTNYPEQGQKRSHWLWFRMSADQSDTYLQPRVRYARHAMAIDERRALFPRAKWGGEHLKTVPENERVNFVQMWFSGNHSDIGGSYPENESRLSDIPLQWMIEQMTKLPHPVLLDETHLKTYPRADGIQHCEVRAVEESGWLRRRFPWKADDRFTASGARHHPSVKERFDLDRVSQSGDLKAYRPAALIYDGDMGPACQDVHRQCLPKDFHVRWQTILEQKPSI